MNFYKHYVGDFQRDTNHLSLTERGAYLALMHHYYATELPLPTDHKALYRIAGAFTKAEQDAVVSILSFFRLADDGWRHDRIDAEIHKALQQATTNRKIAKSRWAKEKSQETGSERQCEPLYESHTESHDDSYSDRTTNRQPNQTPDTIYKNNTSANADRFDEFWLLWPTSTRKVAKAECMKRWKLRKLDTVADQILAHVGAMRQTKQWQDGFEPAPLTYLNQKRWEDGVIADGAPDTSLWANAI